jgi:hypothetical protein
MKCPRCGKENPAEVHTCTPLALRLADHLEQFRSFPSDLEAAAELRRLHTELEATNRNVEIIADELAKCNRAYGVMRDALRQHIRTYQVADDHWAPEEEADRLLEKLVGDALSEAYWVQRAKDVTDAFEGEDE